jgi:hypothetical protein
MTRTYSRGSHTPPWLHAEHIAGFLLGLALAAMAIDHGMRTAPPSSLPLTAARTTGP